MQIDNKYNLKEKVYIGTDVYYVNSIQIQDNGAIEYQLWNPSTNDYSNYSDWQILGSEEKIWFKD